jgi:hypothetical protein
MKHLTGTLIAFLAATCIAISVYATLSDRFASDRRRRELKLYANLDHVFAELREQNCPIFLKFGALSTKDVGFVPTIYFRSVFDMFPIPALVDDPSDTNFFATGILRSNVPRAGPWLTANHIGIVLFIDLSNGNLLFTPRRVPTPSAQTSSP